MRLAPLLIVLAVLSTACQSLGSGSQPRPVVVPETHDFAGTCQAPIEDFHGAVTATPFAPEPSAVEVVESPAPTGLRRMAACAE